MFQWGITLSDKQVIMLTAFHVAKPDKAGCIFHAAQSMIGDAWDIRAVRKLEEQNLITVTHDNAAPKTTVWQITRKGRLIAEAIMSDAENLRRLRLRHGLRSARLINSDARAERKRGRVTT